MKQSTTGLIGAAIGLLGLAYGVYSEVRMTKIANKLDTTLDDLASKTSVDVSKDVVDSAIDKAVDKEVYIVARKAAADTSTVIIKNMRKEVSAIVDSEFGNISKKVSDEIATQVADIDQTAMRDKIIRKAEEKVIEKFDGSLDGTLDKFNMELKNINKVYSSIAESMSNRREYAPWCINK